MGVRTQRRPVGELVWARSDVLLLVLGLCLNAGMAVAIPTACDGNCAIAAAFNWVASAHTPAQPTELVEITLALSHEEAVTRALADRLLRVSDPESESYGEHIPRSALFKLVPPKHGAAEMATRWATDAGATVVPAGSGDLLVVSLTVAQAEALLGVRITAHEHLVTGERILRTLDDLPVPSALRGQVSLIHGLSTWPLRGRSSRSQDSVAIGSPAVTPALIKALYNITDAVSGGDAPAQAVAEFQNQLYDPSDLATFENIFLPGMPAQAARRQSPNSTCSVAARPDPGIPSLCSSEAALDIQYIIASGRGIPTDFYLQPQGKQGFGGDLLAWAASTVADTSPDAPVVWSVSYGEGVNGGIGGRQAVDTVHRMDLEMQKLGVAGVSVLFASGDSGVYNRNPLGEVPRPDLRCYSVRAHVSVPDSNASMARCLQRRCAGVSSIFSSLPPICHCSRSHGTHSTKGQTSTGIIRRLIQRRRLHSCKVLHSRQ